MISIEKQIENTCKYKIHFTFSPTSNSLVDTDGEMTVRGNSVWFKLYDPPTMEFKFFDFELAAQEFLDSEIGFQPGNPFGIEKTTIKVFLQDKIQVTDDLIYIFRAKDVYYYMDFPLDVVYFVSKTKGIIGSHMSTLGGEKEHYLYPKGNTLEDYIDYSKKEKAILE